MAKREERTVGNQLFLAAMTAIVATITAELVLRYLARREIEREDDAVEDSEGTEDTGTDEQ